jgi:hypothetical protein
LKNLVEPRIAKRVTHHQRSDDGQLHDPQYGHCADAGVERQMFHSPSRLPQDHQ